MRARPEADIDDFFKHENHREPPSLSDQEKLSTGTKSALLGCFPGMPEPGRSTAAKEASMVILDMAAVIHMVKPQRAKYFGDYTAMHLLPFLEKQINNNTTRVDAVWDIYPEASLKEQTRAKRSAGSIRTNRVSALLPILKGAEWQTFLKMSQNKISCLSFSVLSYKYMPKIPGTTSSPQKQI